MKSMHSLLATLFLVSTSLGFAAKDDTNVIVAGNDLITSIPSCFDDAIRVSALISSGGKVKVGIVEAESNRSYLVSPGEKAGDVEVVSADYEKETVILRRGTEDCILVLAADPNAKPPPELIEALASSPLYRGEAIENFLKEFPDAIDKGLIKFPLPISPPAKGKGEGIEKFLRENPELAKKVDQPVVGRGEGIEKYLKEHPEIKVNDQPISEGSLGPGIEAAMKDNPKIITNAIPGITPPMPPSAMKQVAP
ncbi:MAG: hypothetical protein V1929_00470 [bacterium]